MDITLHIDTAGLIASLAGMVTLAGLACFYGWLVTRS